MDFDFNLILVPATLIFFLVWLLDKFVFKQRATKGKGNENFLIAWAYDFWPVLAVVLFLRSFLYEPFNIPSESMMPNLKVGDFILVNKYDYGVRLPLIHTKILNTGSPQAGDVVVFRYPENPKQSYIKRVIAVGGDQVQIQDGVISVNGQIYSQEKINAKSINFSIATQEKIETLALNAESYQEKIGERQHVIQQVLVQQKDQIAQSFLKYQDEQFKLIAQNKANALIVGFPTQTQNAQFTVPEGQYFVMGDNRDQSADSRAWGFVPEENLIGRAFYIWMHKESGFNLPSFNRNGQIN